MNIAKWKKSTRKDNMQCDSQPHDFGEKEETKMKIKGAVGTKALGDAHRSMECGETLGHCNSSVRCFLSRSRALSTCCNPQNIQHRMSPIATTALQWLYSDLYSNCAVTRSPAWGPSTNSSLCRATSKALPHLRELVSGKRNSRLSWPGSQAAVSVPMVQSTCSATHTSSPRQPSLGNQPAIGAELNGLSHFFPFPFKDFPPVFSLSVSPHTCFSLSTTFPWPHLGMTSSHLLILSSYSQP